MRVPTPGAYLKMRRCAAGKTPADVARALAVEPQLDERARTEWIELIEADAQPASFRTIVALKRIYPFDLRVLTALERIAQGSVETPPRLCRICACSWEDPCVDIHGPCGWAAHDLCTACARLTAPVPQTEGAAA